MENQSNYLLNGEIHPWIQSNTRNEKDLEKSDRPPRPWDQLEDETTKAYSAFLLYLDLGSHDRSQSKLAKILYGNENSTAQIRKWSVEHDWMNRVDAWDRFCVESRKAKMEEAVEEAENTMLGYLPKVTINLAQAAAGETKVGRSEMRAIDSFLDRVGPAKQRRSAPAIVNNELTVNVPRLPQEVVDDTDDVPEAEVIEESASDLIPEKLKAKRGKNL